MRIMLLIAIVALTQIVRSQTDSCKLIYGRQSSLLVFSGTVKKIRCVNNMGLRYEVVFKVDSVYKGQLSKVIIVYTSTNKEICYTDQPCYLCGFNFKKGERYIVYVCGEEHALYTTNRCTHTQKLAYKENVILRDDLSVP